ncbi:hypothetical protein GPECTOR_45g153 [Gonium pectorale]|uniref:Cytochrome c oxidase copper chaperone n=1 Tax=Gonium pectorale TaxID=33097 RepID=A0A150G938_GONPE|nr:hypothetical protein GPECTOR_45g153 [Gonium pectorale]|eukprot:KXZ46283.1 hypothetical protein GPECTOR_45g153 [Gonium pectorale]
MGASGSTQKDAAPAPALPSPSPAPPGVPIGPDGKPKKICCTCPDTKKLRDTCIAERGEEHAYCQALIEAHKACLRVEGFKV